MLRMLKIAGMFFLIECCNISCCSTKTLFIEKPQDGLEIVGSKQKCTSGKKGKYLLLDVKDKNNKVHSQYFVNRFSCDTLTKKVFKDKKVQVLIFTTDSKIDLPVTGTDRSMLSKMTAFVDSSNFCLVNFINNIKGFTIYYDGKVKK